MPAARWRGSRPEGAWVAQRPGRQGRTHTRRRVGHAAEVGRKQAHPAGEKLALVPLALSALLHAVQHHTPGWRTHQTWKTSATPPRPCFAAMPLR